MHPNGQASGDEELPGNSGRNWDDGAVASIAWEPVLHWTIAIGCHTVECRVEKNLKTHPFGPPIK